MDQNKKDKERKLLEVFRNHYPDFPNGKLKASESPDFILMLNRKASIGIEVTSFYPPAFFKTDENFLIHQNDEEAILNLIKSKDEKIPSYRRHLLKQLWLVVVIDPVFHKSSFRLNIKYLRKAISTRFDKVFVLLLPNKLFLISED